MHALEHVAGAGDIVLGPFDDDLVAARSDVHPEPVFELNQVSVEFAEQRAEHRLFIECNLRARAARSIAAVLGMAQRRLAVGAIGFTGHALLSLARPRSAGQGQDRRPTLARNPWSDERRDRAIAFHSCLNP